jgi:hypothetical protein
MNSSAGVAQIDTGGSSAKHLAGGTAMFYTYIGKLSMVSHAKAQRTGSK